MSNLVLTSPPLCSMWGPKCNVNRRLIEGRLPRRVVGTKAFFFNPSDEPILKEAIKEPVAFMGGIFAGLLRLDLNEEPLKEWINRTVEASGISQEDIDVQGPESEEAAPQQIDIE